MRGIWLLFGTAAAVLFIWLTSIKPSSLHISEALTAQRRRKAVHQWAQRWQGTATSEQRAVQSASMTPAVQLPSSSVGCSAERRPYHTVLTASSGACEAATCSNG